MQHLLLQDPLPGTQAPPAPEPAPVPTPVHSANAVQQPTDLLPTLLAQMAQMQTNMLAMQRQLNTQNQPTPAPTAPTAPKRPTRKGTKHCWTHGMGKHDGTQCENKAQGHQDQATKDNRMGGSNRGCNNE